MDFNFVNLFSGFMQSNPVGFWFTVVLLFIAILLFVVGIVGFMYANSRG